MADHRKARIGQAEAVLLGPVDSARGPAVRCTSCSAVQRYLRGSAAPNMPCNRSLSLLHGVQ